VAGEPLSGSLGAGQATNAWLDTGQATNAWLYRERPWQRTPGSGVQGTAQGGTAIAVPQPEEWIDGGRDSTALTMVEVDLGTLSDPLLKAPTYRVVSRRLWTGVDHTLLYAQLRSLIEEWRARYVVIDATGVGAGLSSFLERAFPGKVLPFIFSQSSKSKLGWDFLGVVDSGRFKEVKLRGCPLCGQPRARCPARFSANGEGGFPSLGYSKIKRPSTAGEMVPMKVT
jgi:hypothetical protein